MRHVDEKFYLMLGMLMLYEGMHELFGFPVANFATGAIICMGSVLSLIAKRGS